MRLRDYANKIGVTYRTAYSHFKAGIIKGTQLETGTILVDLEESSNKPYKQIKDKGYRVVLYARISSSENKDNLISQLDRIRNYAELNNYTIVKEITEIGSGLNDKRKKLLSLLSSDIQYDKIIVEHKDRFSRFGTSFIEVLLKRLGIDLEIINTVEPGREDIVQDFISIITSFSAKIYGIRRSKRRTISILNNIENDDSKSRIQEISKNLYEDDE